MGKIEKLKDFIKITNWLDAGRWKSIPVKKECPDYEKLAKKNCSLAVLCHWLVYISDKQRDSGNVWNNEKPIVSAILLELNNKKVKTPKEILQIVKLFKSKKEEHGKKITRLEKNSYAFAFGDWGEFYGFLRTLIYFFHINKTDFIKFLFKQFESEKQVDEIESAHKLYFITYKSVEKAKSHQSKRKRVFNLISNWWNEKGDCNGLINEIKKDLDGKKWRKEEFEEKRFTSKRLWAALRDYYKIDSKVYNEEIKRSHKINRMNYEKKHHKHVMELIELPGDIWNERFCERVMGPLIKDNLDNKALDSVSNVKTGKLNYPNAIRSLFDKNKKLFKELDSYPEKLDFTVLFAANICKESEKDKRICSMLCPLNNASKLKQFCLGKEKKDKICSVILYCLGIIIACKKIKKICPVNNRIKSRICRGLKQDN